MLNGKNESAMDILMSKREILRRLNSITIKPSGLKQRKYGISVKYFSNNEQNPYKRIDYELTTDLIIDGHEGVLTIDKKDIHYNQHKADNINEILGSSISKAFYPVKTHLNEKGLCTNEILNHEEIKERWKKEKSIILEKYNSEYLDNFFHEADKNFSNKYHLENSLQFDWFWNLFFHPKFINYGDTRQKETALFLSVVPYQFPVKFSGIQTIHKIPTDFHSFTIDFQSKEQKAHPYFISKKHKASNSFMTLKVVFELDLYHHFPMHIRADFEVFSKDQFGNKISIKKIKYTQFQQNTEDFKQMKLSNTSPFITGGLIVSEPNKWGFYKNKYENDW
jgi:hypothetical protein